MHEGHRRRMYEKLKNHAYTYDHEVLEMLLFNAYPRVNTNPIAHELLNTFGSLAGVFEAEAEELTKIKGVGEGVAYYLKCIGESIKIVNKNDSNIATLKSYADFCKFCAFRLCGLTKEVLEFYCMDKIGKVLKIVTFTSDERGKVEVDIDKISKFVTAVRPYGIVIAHNHLSGVASPSENDDKFTAEMQALFSMNNVNLLDHCIYAGDDNVYSYFISGKIEDIKRNFSFGNLINEKYKNEKMRKNKI